MVNMQVLNKLNINTVNNKQIPATKNLRMISFAGKPDFFEKGNSLKDPDINKLNQLSKQYKQSGDIKDKHKLFEQEEKILWQEVEEPAKYLNRALSIGAIDSDLLPKDPQERIAKLRECSLGGLYSHYKALKILNIPMGDLSSHFSLIEKMIKETPDTSPSANGIKLNSIELFSYIYKNLDICTQKRMKTLLVDLIKKDNNSTCKTYALDTLVKLLPPNDYAFHEIQSIIENPNTETAKKTILINMGKIRSPKLEIIIPQLLKDEKADHSLKVAATWCAGRVKTEENFGLLSNIINSTSITDKDIELKEMALHSFALYLKKHPVPVKITLEKISKSDSSLNDLAHIMLLKTQGKFNLEDRFLNENISDLSERKEYKILRSKYIEELKNLNTKQKNCIDKDLVPYFKALKKLTEMGAKCFILNDTITTKRTDLVGQRTGDGRFKDSCTALSGTDKKIIITNARLDEPYDMFAHELKHSIHDFIIDKTDYDHLEKLYKKAKKEDKCLDSYGAWNSHEYFAQGYEAYTSIYKPHINLMDSDNFDSCYFHTKSVLKRKDPELFKFIEHCIKKYGQVDKN